MIFCQPSRLTALHLHKGPPSPGPQTLFQALQFIHEPCLRCTMEAVTHWWLPAYQPFPNSFAYRPWFIYFFVFRTDISSGKASEYEPWLSYINYGKTIPFSLYSDWFRGACDPVLTKDLRRSLLGDSGKDFLLEIKEEKMLSLLPAFEYRWGCASHLVTVWRRAKEKDLWSWLRTLIILELWH